MTGDERRAIGLIQFAKKSGRQCLSERLDYLERRTSELRQELRRKRLKAPDEFDEPDLSEMPSRIMAVRVLLDGDDVAAAVYAMAECERRAAAYSFDEIARPLAGVREGQEKGRDKQRENNEEKFRERDAEIERLDGELAIVHPHLRSKSDRAERIKDGFVRPNGRGRPEHTEGLDRWIKAHNAEREGVGLKGLQFISADAISRMLPERK